MFYDQAILIQGLKEWAGVRRLFCFIRYGRDARATLTTSPLLENAITNGKFAPYRYIAPSEPRPTKRHNFHM
jgi:hypothetical protein